MRRTVLLLFLLVVILDQSQAFLFGGRRGCSSDRECPSISRCPSGRYGFLNVCVGGRQELRGRCGTNSGLCGLFGNCGRACIEVWIETTSRKTVPKASIELSTGYFILRIFFLKVLTNVKRGGLLVVSFDRSRFKLFLRKFFNKFRQAPSYERPKTAPRTLFLSFESNNFFPITVKCRRLMKKSGKLACHGTG
jgi:hypothetical protein